ncbi:MAG: ASKHA domain-containing protein, partial [Clostridia bacterium]|nr:ASKHA domain-containing protein [Clostridia bacterium]
MAKVFIVENGIIKETSVKTEAVYDCEKISVAPYKEGYGAAVDFGTTTVVLQIINLANGEVLSTETQKNAGAKYGADIISRIASFSSEHTAILRKQIFDMLTSAKEKAKIKDISGLTVSANTTLLHIIAGVSPKTIGEYPYTPVFTEEKTFNSKEFFTDCNDDFVITILPSISGYIGADILSGLLTIDDDNFLFVDLGTNGEIALKTNGKYYMTSTAIGPAFEGGSIECGTAGISGAINKVELSDDDISVCTIDNEKPVGICGSGLVDAIAVLRELNAVDSDGLMNGEKQYIKDNIYLSQKDIRQFQLAKSAVYSGIMALLNAVNVKTDSIKTCYIAGGVGFYLNAENAVKIKMLPSFFSKFKSIGNSSLKGARIYLADKNAAENAQKIIENSTVINLATETD